MRVEMAVLSVSIALIGVVPLSAQAQEEPRGIAARVAQLEAQVEALEVALAQAQEILQFVRVE